MLTNPVKLALFEDGKKGGGHPIKKTSFLKQSGGNLNK